MSTIKYSISAYTGNKIGNSGFCARVGVQIVATDAETGKRRYVFGGGRTPCYKVQCGAAHYKGASRAVAEALNVQGARLREIAARLNAGEIGPESL